MGVETQVICHGNRYHIVTYESGVHDRLYVLETSEDIGEAELEGIAELVGEEEKKRDTAMDATSGESVKIPAAG